MDGSHRIMCVDESLLDLTNDSTLDMEDGRTCVSNVDCLGSLPSEWW
jgi:hypothetical protein